MKEIKNECNEELDYEHKIEDNEQIGKGSMIKTFKMDKININGIF